MVQCTLSFYVLYEKKSKHCNANTIISINVRYATAICLRWASFICIFKSNIASLSSSILFSMLTF